jgi:galactose mutarotase-like enzyme
VNKLVLSTAKSQATILPERGALTSSLLLSGQSTDLLWMPGDFDGEASSWPGGGLPFLFPFAGRVWHHGELYKYGLSDQSYPMPLHGFSWATRWSVTDSAPAKARLRLSDSEESRSVYPFEFQIDMSVQLGETSLHMDVTITHKRPCGKASAMPVAAGWHPYFNLIGRHLHVDIPARSFFNVTSQGNAGKASPMSALNQTTHWELPDERLKSLILTELTGSRVAFTETSGSGFNLDFGPHGVMNHIVTWSNKPDEFLCVEPWMSLPDAVAAQTGCRWLEPGQSVSTSLTISSR